jgi:hypothetical protein
VGTLADPGYYLQPLPLMQPAPNFRGDAGGQAAQLTAHTLYVTVSVANVNPGSLSSLTAGSLSVAVCGVQLQGTAGIAPVITPGVVTLGTLMGGVCLPFGTGVHLNGAPANAVMLSNEPVANCRLP